MRTIATALLVGVMLACVPGLASAQAPAAGATEATEPSEAVAGGAPVDLSADEDAASITIVAMSTLQDGATISGKPWSESLQISEDMLATMHAAVNDNAALKAKLTASGFSVDDVVAVEQTVEGATIAYVDDRQ